MLYKNKCVTLILISSFVASLILLSRLYHISLMTGLQKSNLLPFHTGKRNAGSYVTLPTVQRYVRVRVVWSLEPRTQNRLERRKERKKEIASSCLLEFIASEQAAKPLGFNFNRFSGFERANNNLQTLK